MAVPSRSKYWDPKGNVDLYAEGHVFRIHDEQGRFDGSAVQFDNVNRADVEVLLAGIASPSPFARIAEALERIPPTSPANDALKRFGTGAISRMLPTTRTFSGSASDYAEDALVLAVKYDADMETRKKLWYHVVTTREFHEDRIKAHTLPPELRTRCTTLLNTLISHFTAILFTPPPTSHMSCTDIVAGNWMSTVIQPALETDGVYKPLESLDMMKKVDWVGMGVCATCVAQKREEWDAEADTVWRFLGGWIQ